MSNEEYEDGVECEGQFPPVLTEVGEHPHHAVPTHPHHIVKDAVERAQLNRQELQTHYVRYIPNCLKKSNLQIFLPKSAQRG